MTNKARDEGMGMACQVSTCEAQMDQDPEEARASQCARHKAFLEAQAEAINDKEERDTKDTSTKARGEEALRMLEAVEADKAELPGGLFTAFQDTAHENALGGAEEVSRRQREVSLSALACKLAYVADLDEVQRTVCRQASLTPWDDAKMSRLVTGAQHSRDVRVFETGGTVLIAFRGTDVGGADWLRDLRDDLNVQADDANDVNVLGGGLQIEGAQVHRGFRTRAETCDIEACLALLRSEGTERIILTGHSLGGSAAQCLALRLLRDPAARTKLHCIAFGMALTVNKQVAEYIYAQYPHHFTCIQYTDDAVPRLMLLGSGANSVGAWLTRAAPRIGRAAGAAAEKLVPVLFGAAGVVAVWAIGPLACHPAAGVVAAWAKGHVQRLAREVVRPFVERHVEESAHRIGQGLTSMVPLGSHYLCTCNYPELSVHALQRYTFNWTEAHKWMTKMQAAWVYRLCCTDFLKRTIEVHKLAYQLLVNPAHFEIRMSVSSATEAAEMDAAAAEAPM